MCKEVPASPTPLPPSKISEKVSPLELQQFKIHQCPPNFRKGWGLIPCIIVHLLENQKLNLFW